MGSYKVPEKYPPQKWSCPGCDKKHSGPHYALPGQIDYNLKPAAKGRVVFNRRNKDDTLDSQTPVYNYKPKEGDRYDSDGYQRPIFCPHCGWEDTWVVIDRKGTIISLIEQFLTIMNGDVETIDAADALQQFMGFLKGKGVVN